MKDERKLTFDGLCIEVTRRCNMLCPHCFRGEQQNIDIDNSYIDELFRKTDIIHSLEITGGEPTLAIDKLEYIIDKLYEYKIPIFEFHLFTNALIFNDRIVSVLKRYGELVKLCREIGCKNDLLPSYKNVLIEVSIDKFHSNKETVENNFQKYKTALDGLASVYKKAVGNVYNKLGRAKNLPGGVKNTNFKDRVNKRIEILDKEHKPLCPQYETYKLLDSQQILICCDMYLNCHGNLLAYSLGSYEYEVEDNEKYIVCNVFNDDIYSAILKYNEGKTDCLTLFKLNLENTIKHPLNDLSDKLFILAHQSENDSDIPIMNKGHGWVDLDEFTSIMAIRPETVNDLIAFAENRDYMK